MTLTIPAQNQKVLNLIAFLILLVSVLIVPKQLLDVAPIEKAMGVSVLLLIYGFWLVRAQPDRLQFSLTDIGWLLLIALTFLSAFWALNPYKAIYGGFTTLVLYLTYRVFLHIEWTTHHQKLIRVLFLIFSVIALGIILYSIMNLSGQTQRLVTGINAHYLGSLVVVVMPFILLLKKGKLASIFSTLIVLAIRDVLLLEGN